METQMLTLWGADLEVMNKDQLQQELRVQKWLYATIKNQHAIQVYKDMKTPKVSRTRMDRIELLEIYMKGLEGMIAAIEHYIPIRAYDKDSRRSASVRAKEEAERKKRLVANNDERIRLGAREGINLQWDKDKFLLVAKDRGYQTEEAINAAVQKQLKISYNKARLMINSGRFTWGQVLLVGALLEMTPKEFCDIFMSGYFVECAGSYMASDKNIDYKGLMRRSIWPDWDDNAAPGEQE